MATWAAVLDFDCETSFSFFFVDMTFSVLVGVIADERKLGARSVKTGQARDAAPEARFFQGSVKPLAEHASEARIFQGAARPVPF